MIIQVQARWSVISTPAEGSPEERVRERAQTAENFHNIPWFLLVSVCRISLYLSLSSLLKKKKTLKYVLVNQYTYRRHYLFMFLQNLMVKEYCWRYHTSHTTWKKSMLLLMWKFYPHWLYQRCKVIISPTQLWNLKATVMTGLARHAHWC